MEEGEVLGIIGHNGAGKSTLLKILSRITEPTSGQAFLRGRVSSLLEVGTGFHGEMTGRENIYLNGSLYGLKSKDITKQLDSIIDFAQVEEFIDTPVKRYSSGMYVRLAFAVAAHLQPEILIVDEVLAVGDAAFQKKCITRLNTEADKGKTILIVSHNMSIITQISSKCILLNSGAIEFSGNSQEAVSLYFGSSVKSTQGNLGFSDKKGPQKFSTINRAGLVGGLHENSNMLEFGKKLTISLEVETYEKVENFEIGLSIRKLNGQTVGTALNTWEGFKTAYSKGTHKFEIEIPQMYVIPENYFVTAWTKIEKQTVDCQILKALELNILNCNIDENVNDFGQYENAGVFIRSSWKLI